MSEKISVVLTTYNGEKYILEQLDSLKNQRVKIDEVLIADDMSTDKTVDVIKTYIEDNHLSHWKLFINDENLGWKKNFHNIIKVAIGDVIFFSDQDDIWDINKISEMYELMITNKSINVLSCKAKYINSEGEKLEISSKVLPFGVDNSKDVGTIYKNCFDRKFLYSIMPGCTMCVRKSYVDFIYRINNDPILPHDALFWKTAIILDSCYSYNKELISYRIHGDNASAPSTSASYEIKSIEKRIEEANIFKTQIAEILVLDHYIKSKYRNDLIRIKEFTTIRNSFLEKKVSWGIIKYFYYYRDIKMFCGDVLIRLKKS